MDKAGLQALVRREAADVAEKHKLLFLVSKAELWKGLEESEVMGVLREAVAETASGGVVYVWYSCSGTLACPA